MHRCSWDVHVSNRWMHGSGFVTLISGTYYDVPQDLCSLFGLYKWWDSASTTFHRLRTDASGSTCIRCPPVHIHTRGSNTAYRQQSIVWVSESEISCIACSNMQGLLRARNGFAVSWYIWVRATVGLCNKVTSTQHWCIVHPSRWVQTTFVLFTSFRSSTDRTSWNLLNSVTGTPGQQASSHYLPTRPINVCITPPVFARWPYYPLTTALSRFSRSFLSMYASSQGCSGCLFPVPNIWGYFYPTPCTIVLYFLAMQTMRFLVLFVKFIHQNKNLDKSTADQLSLLSDRIRLSKQLVTLSCPPLDWAAWKHLSNLRTLVVAVVTHFLGLWNRISSISRHSFTSRLFPSWYTMLHTQLPSCNTYNSPRWKVSGSIWTLWLQQRLSDSFERCLTEIRPWNNSLSYLNDVMTPNARL